MADAETEKEWAKSKRIEAERMKAAREIAKEETDKTNLAFLDPTVIKKGWSNDDNAIFKSIEKVGNRSIILAICGVVLNIIGTVGGMVSMTNKLGLAGALISDLPSMVGIFCIGVAVLMALVTIGSELYYKKRQGRRFDAAMWSAVGAFAVIVVYIAIRLILFIG